MQALGKHSSATPWICSFCPFFLYSQKSCSVFCCLPSPSKDKAFFLEPTMGRFTISRPLFCGELDCSTMLWLCFVCLVVNAGKTFKQKCFYYASKTCAGLLMKRKGGEPHGHKWYFLKKPCVHRHPSFLLFLLHRWGFPQDCECFVCNCFKKKKIFSPGQGSPDHWGLGQGSAWPKAPLWGLAWSLPKAFSMHLQAWLWLWTWYLYFCYRFSKL